MNFPFSFTIAVACILIWEYLQNANAAFRGLTIGVISCYEYCGRKVPWNFNAIPLNFGSREPNLIVRYWTHRGWIRERDLVSIAGIQLG
jgi:hypothetical protein